MGGGTTGHRRQQVLAVTWPGAPAALRSVVVAISVLVLPPSHHPRRSKADPERDLTTSYGSNWSAALPDVRRRERALDGSRRGSPLRTHRSKLQDRSLFGHASEQEE
jgi:hypothetical protein